MQGHVVVDARANAAGAQPTPKSVAVLRLYYVQVIHVHRFLARHRERDGGLRERLRVPVCCGASLPVPLGQVRQLRPEDGGLNSVQSAAEPRLDMQPLIVLSVTSQQPDLIGQGIVVRSDDPAIAHRAHPLLIGEGGQMLRRIGQGARAGIQELLGKKVYLELWVKVREKWRRDERQLRRLGYALED